ncbi:MAG: hypothetical protein P8Y23_07330 [Candidatus Lokiarchaeota archaeon]|jgi:hypothetical protein
MKYEYNIVENGIIYIKEDYKKKGKEYGFIELNKNLSSFLVEIIDLMSVSPNISPKFSEKVEKYLMPRYSEVNEIVYAGKELATQFKVEISKENQKDILNALTLPTVITGLGKKGNLLKELSSIMKKVGFSKFK